MIDSALWFLALVGIGCVMYGLGYSDGRDRGYCDAAEDATRTTEDAARMTP